MPTLFWVAWGAERPAKPASRHRKTKNTLASTDHFEAPSSRESMQT